MTQSETISPRLRQALAYAEAGIPVFPCQVGSKEPATAHSFYDATTDVETIRRIWSEADYNIGLCPEHAGWSVVDLDGAAGLAWKDLPKCPPTRTVTTPSDGLHLYFIGSLPASASKIAPHVDTRGVGSYVLVPPSVVDGRAYRVTTDVPIAPLPAFIPEKLAQREMPRLTAPASVEIDAEWMVDLARAELRERVAKGDVATEGIGGDDRTYRLFTRLYDLGLSEATALEIVAEEWNPHCSPPWPDDELAEKAEHAWKYKQNEAGARALPDPAVWKVEQYAPPPPEPEPAEFPSFEAAAAIAARPVEEQPFLWEDRIIEAMPAYITGKDGSGKTTIAENLAVAIAAGIPLWGKATIRQPVYLLVGEDSAAYVTRNLARIREAMQAPEDCLQQIHVLSTYDAEVNPRLVSIDDNGKVNETPFMAHIAAMLRPPCVFWIDPLAEFAMFDRYSDVPARALSATWLRAFTRMGVTPIVNDHPSRAGTAAGDHFAGVQQLRAPFPVHAAVLAGEWTGAASRQREITLSFRKIRQRAEHDVKLVRRENSPVFVLQGGVNHTPDDHQLAVYRHVRERIDAGELVASTNHGYGSQIIAAVLELDEAAVKYALAALCGREWLRKEKGAGYVTGPKAPSLSDLDGF